MGPKYTLHRYLNVSLHSRLLLGLGTPSKVLSGYLLTVPACQIDIQNQIIFHLDKPAVWVKDG